MPARSPARSQLQFCFDVVEEVETMNESAAPALMFSNVATLPDAPASCVPTQLTSLPASCTAVQLNTPAPAERGSVAALMQRHAHKQAQGLAPLTKREKLPKSADDTPLSVLAYALREVPPDKLLQQAQEAGDFAAACRRIRQATSRWAKDLLDEVRAEKRELTAGERQGVAFWQCEARDAETALRIFQAVGSDTRAAVSALENADLERYADALRTGCFLTLGL